MFDLGWPEMAVIMLVAIIVIGPKDLPRMARTIGKWTGKARAMARDFQRSLDDMAREAELDEIKKSVEKIGSPNKLKSTLTSSIKDTIDKDDEIEDAMNFDVKKPASPPADKTVKAKAADQKAESGAKAAADGEGTA